MGTLDWEKKRLCWRRFRLCLNSGNRRRIRRQGEALCRDRPSFQSGRELRAAGEFSKLASSVGTGGLNAATGLDFTVYMGEVPANELGKYLKLDAERFSGPVLRLFHTELETVYEEFNRSQDRDGSLSYEALCRAILPTHPAGRPIIGLPEHLKNPSMKDIMKFFRDYYVPGNMAIALVGDIEFEKAYRLVADTFGKIPAGNGAGAENARGKTAGKECGAECERSRGGACPDRLPDRPKQTEFPSF